MKNVKMRKANIDDGFNSELVYDAEFDGELVEKHIKNIEEEYVFMNMM